MLFWGSVLLLGALGAQSACLTTCADIAAHTVNVANGTHDFDGECAGSYIEISSSDSATFGFPIEDDLWALTHTFTDSTIRFLAHSNQSAAAKLKISIEEQGVVHVCNGGANNTVDNETYVMWTVPSFVEGEHYSTPDLSTLLNSLTVCPTFAVFQFTSFFGNGTAEGARQVTSFETNVNATRLTLNAACPATPPAATTGTASTSSETSGLTPVGTAFLVSGIVLFVLLCIGAAVWVGI